MIETTLEQMRESYDWKEVFSYAHGFALADVADVLASVDGENDGANWVAVFRLKDGRFAYLTAWCDYTGWGCQEGGDSTLADSEEEIAKSLTDDDRSRLNWPALAPEVRQ